MIVSDINLNELKQYNIIIDVVSSKSMDVVKNGVYIYNQLNCHDWNIYKNKLFLKCNMYNRRNNIDTVVFIKKDIKCGRELYSFQDINVFTIDSVSEFYYMEGDLYSLKGINKKPDIDEMICFLKITKTDILKKLEHHINLLATKTYSKRYSGTKLPMDTIIEFAFNYKLQYPETDILNYDFWVACALSVTKNYDSARDYRRDGIYAIPIGLSSRIPKDFKKEVTFPYERLKL